MDSEIEIRTVRGPEICALLEGIADLRIRVFREFPYLYDGDPSYEERYLERYGRSTRSVAVLALEGGRPVGASTGLPIEEAESEFQQPFIEAGFDLSEIFYCGESVLLPEFRGRGIYRHFFTGREAHALSLPGIRMSAFCAVDRGAGHPLCPPGYTPLDGVWRRYGYRLEPGLRGEFSWKDIDQAGETCKVMQFYLKDLRVG